MENVSSTNLIIVCASPQNEKSAFSEKNHKLKKFKSENIINLSLNLKLYKSKTFLFLRNEESPYIPEFLEKYTIIEGLGSGYQGKVFKVLSKKEKELYVAKIIMLKDDEASHLSNNEILVLKTVRHLNLPVYVEDFTSETQLILITKYFPSLCLNSYLQHTPLSLHYIKSIVFQLLTVVQYLHSLSIMHRDIKPSNILISRVDKEKSPNIFEFFDQKDIIKKKENSPKLSIKLIDFGVSKIYSPNEDNFSPYGEPNSRSPEMRYDGAYDEKVDIWGVGIVMMGLCLGKEIVTLDLMKLKEGKTPEILDIKGKDVLKNLLSLKASERISEKDALNHEWFKQ